jgi:hypothetical protein
MEPRLQQQWQAPPLHTPTEARLQSGLGGGELGSGLMIDLSGVTTTCSDGRWLLLPHYVANGGLLPLRLDLGLEGSDSV